MNIYLEKIASWKNPKKFLGYVTGSASKDAGARVKHMEEAIANKTNLRDLHRRKKYVDDQTFKARIAAGVAGTTVVGASGTGYVAYRNKQKRDSDAQLAQFFKQAGAMGEAGKTLGGGLMSGIGKTLSTIGRGTANLISDARGNQIARYGQKHGLKYGTKTYDTFMSSKYQDQAKSLLQNGSNKRLNYNDHVRTLRDLHRSKTNARIALGGVAGTGLAGYGYMHARKQLDQQPQYYN